MFDRDVLNIDLEQEAEVYQKDGEVALSKVENLIAQGLCLPLHLGGLPDGMAAIRERTVDRSLLLMTHRLIDLHWMDYIVMLDKGQVVAQGTHEELLQGNLQYASLHRRIP